MLHEIYRWLYSSVGGRPWTHIAREATRARPIEVIAIMFVFGVLLGNLLPWQAEAVLYLGLVFGIIFGHFWWGPPPEDWYYPGGPE